MPLRAEREHENLLALRCGRVERLRTALPTFAKEIDDLINKIVTRMWSLFQDRLMGVFRPFAHQEADTEDLCQDFSLKIRKIACSFRAGCGDFRSLLLASATHFAIDKWRCDRAGGRALPLHMGTPDPPAKGPDPCELAARAECASLGEHLMSAIALLHPDQQRVLRMHLFDQHSWRDISKETRLSVCSVRRLYREALDRLRREAPD